MTTTTTMMMMMIIIIIIIIIIISSERYYRPFIKLCASVKKARQVEDRFISLATLKNPLSITIPEEKFEIILRPPGGREGEGGWRPTI